MATYTVVNASSSALTDINAGGVDLDPLSYKLAVTLTNTELAAAASTKGVFVTSDLTGVTESERIRRIAAIAGTYLSA